MTKLNIIRAWKESEYYNSLSAEMKAMVPPNPAGEMSTDLAGFAGVTGGRKAASKGRLAASCTASSSSTCCKTN